ncbi:MAG: hypothetical protein IPO66_10070 [Rhodanobacteraceae bacterium]|nr:hypothetical protein [Rhodanobacteraceae bacterium]
MSSFGLPQLRNWRALRDSRVSLAPTFAMVGLILVLGDQLLLWLLAWVVSETGGTGAGDRRSAVCVAQISGSPGGAPWHALCCTACDTANGAGLRCWRRLPCCSTRSRWHSTCACTGRASRRGRLRHRHDGAPATVTPATSRQSRDRLNDVDGTACAAHCGDGDKQTRDGPALTVPDLFAASSEVALLRPTQAGPTPVAMAETPRHALPRRTIDYGVLLI